MVVVAITADVAGSEVSYYCCLLLTLLIVVGAIAAEADGSSMRQ